MKFFKTITILAISLLTVVFIIYNMKSSVQREYNRERSYYHGQKFPQVISIGARKCGTGALRTFIGKHSKIALSLVDEAHFFDSPLNYEKGPEFYSKLLPKNVQDGTVIFEKTPKYFPTLETPGRIQKFYNDTYPKLILVLCDPVSRLYSDYNMMIKSKNNFRMAELVKQLGSFDEFVNGGIAYVNDRTKTLDHNTNIELWVNKMRNIFNDDLIVSGGTLYSGFFVGMYAIHLHNWMSYFDKKDILILNGETLVTKPWVIMEKVQNFLNLEVELTEDNFVLDPEKMLYCIQTNVNKKCIDKGATRTVKKNKMSSEISSETADKLRDFYKPFNHKLLEIMPESFAWMK